MAFPLKIRRRGRALSDMHDSAHEYLHLPTANLLVLGDRVCLSAAQPPSTPPYSIMMSCSGEKSTFMHDLRSTYLSSQTEQISDKHFPLISVNASQPGSKYPFNTYLRVFDHWVSIWNRYPFEPILPTNLQYASNPSESIRPSDRFCIL